MTTTKIITVYELNEETQSAEITLLLEWGNEHTLSTTNAAKAIYENILKHLDKLPRKTKKDFYPDGNWRVHIGSTIEEEQLELNLH